MAVFLLAPDMPRLTNLFILNRHTEPVLRPPFFKRKWFNRVAVAVPIYLASTFLARICTVLARLIRTLLVMVRSRPYTASGWLKSSRSMAKRGPPLTTDQTRWQRMIFQFPGSTVIQPMTGPNQNYRVQVELEKKTFKLSKASDQNWKADFSFEQTTPELITLEGQMDGHQTQAKLRRFDESKISAH